MQHKIQQLAVWTLTMVLVAMLGLIGGVLHVAAQSAQDAGVAANPEAPVADEDLYAEVESEEAETEMAGTNHVYRKSP